LEAHLYTNELLTALGYPPYHELGPTQRVTSLNAFRTQEEKKGHKLSPEMETYLDIHEKARSGVNTKTRDRLSDLQGVIELEQGGKANAKTSEKPKLTLAEKLLGGDRDWLVIDGKQDTERALLSASRMPEFHEQGKAFDQTLNGFGKTSEEQRQKVFELAGEASTVLRTLRQIDAKYGKKRDQIPTNVFENVDERVKGLMKLSINEIMTIARFLETLDAEKQPTNPEIATNWYQEEYPTGMKAWFSGIDKHIQRQFGMPGQRTGLGEKFVQDWVDLRDYAKYFLPDSIYPPLKPTKAKE
jgi:hypothetical protein